MGEREEISKDACATLILSNVAKELASLAEAADDIDRVCSEFAPQFGMLRKEQSLGLQRVDLLRQSLECLSHLVGNLAEQNESSGGIPVDLLVKNVYLERIRQICVAKV